jgi:hypothetical protein
MELQEPMRKILNRKYEPSSIIVTRYERYDIAIKTDKDGDAMVLLMGRKDEQGQVKGERFTRRLKQTLNGNIIKDRWEHKGNTDKIP